MPELPDIEVYVDSLDKRVRGENLAAIRIANPFLLRSVSPPISEANGRCITTVNRLGKRIVFALEGELYLVLHLMIAGRLKWSKPGTPIPGRSGLAEFDFTSGTLLLTEAGSKRRASLFLVDGEQGLAAHDSGKKPVIGSLRR